MISKYLGFDSDYIYYRALWSSFDFIYINNCKYCSDEKLKKNYRIFMSGKDAKTLEDTLIQRLDQVDSLLEQMKKMTAILKYSLKICSVPIRRWD